MAKAMTPTDIILALIVEMVGLGVVVTLAGLSDDVGTTIIVLMFGLWLLFLIHHQSTQAWITGLMTRIQGQLNGVVNG